MAFSNYHTHTLHCDGKDTVESITQEALRLGCPEIGFSGHAFMFFHPVSFGMTKASSKEYDAAVAKAQRDYRNQILIYHGIEQDYYCDTPVEEYDYVIGSVHYLYKNGEYCAVDSSAEKLRDGCERLYGSDPMALVEHYYELVAATPDRSSCDILGHFDLVTKFTERDPLFDFNSPRYRRIALSALEKIATKKVVMELNTGAISRGYRSNPYPAEFLLDAASALKIPVVFSSDAHQKEALLFGFEKMSELASKYKLAVMSTMKEVLEFTRS